LNVIYEPDLPAATYHAVPAFGRDRHYYSTNLRRRPSNSRACG
jgi:hypothetical protein